MLTTDDYTKAVREHKRRGGFLYDLGGQYQVTDIHPAEMRSFRDFREAMDYAMRLAEAGYDETKMEVPVE